jgi:hypothetical protein
VEAPLVCMPAGEGSRCGTAPSLEGLPSIAEQQLPDCDGEPVPDFLDGRRSEAVLRRSSSSVSAVAHRRDVFAVGFRGRNRMSG